MQRDATFDAIDNASQTLFDVALRKKRLRMVEFLLDAGAIVKEPLKSSGSKEIDFFIQEYYANNSVIGATSPLSWQGSIVSRSLRRSSAEKAVQRMQYRNFIPLEWKLYHIYMQLRVKSASELNMDVFTAFRVPNLQNHQTSDSSCRGRAHPAPPLQAPGSDSR